MLLQVDGSKHDWLGGPWLTLHAAIDDATNEVPWALFRQEEDATGYALLLHHISQTHGLPLALYADRHTIFQSPKEATLKEQLEGLEPRSQLGRLLDSLDIRLIGAWSPQAKGRVERLFQTFQVRLVKELRRAGAGSLCEANTVLKRYLPHFNKRFIKAPTQPGSAYRPPLTLTEANARICFSYWRTVANLRLLLAKAKTVEAEAKVDSAIFYIQNRLQMMDYPHFRKRGYLIGSGNVESGHKVVVQRRMKGAGMRWAEENVDSMLALRSAVCNRRWEAVWEQAALFRQEQQVLKQQVRVAARKPPPSVPITFASLQAAG